MADPKTRCRDWWALAIYGVTLAAYFPALRGGLVWDDDAHVTKESLRSLHGLWRIWFDLGATQQYYPVLHSAFWVEHRLWVTRRWAIIWSMFSCMRRRRVCLPCCCGGCGKADSHTKRLRVPLPCGLLFAMHPICVESVAWISEQKNTLSAVFYLWPPWHICASKVGTPLRGVRSFHIS